MRDDGWDGLSEQREDEGAEEHSQQRAASINTIPIPTRSAVAA